MNLEQASIGRVSVCTLCCLNFGLFVMSRRDDHFQNNI